MLGPTDALPHRPRRILVAGPSGSGKTTLAARIAEVLDVAHVELDFLFHGPGWTPRPSFEEDVHRFSAGPAWVTEWQYGSVRDHLLERADLLVWLDLPKTVVMHQVTRRTVVRRLRRQVLWNGNVEPPLRAFFSDPNHIVRWAWKTHRTNAARVSVLARQQSGVPVVRLRSHTEAHHWLQGPLRTSPSPGTDLT
ncbi:AAA family ATPase [Kineococcus sp. NPDC059986]|uniref:AAA family ATPase n=1 Tax=Kineococcus sp. NPDC059986 TaxID=3155538 RepID=UPI00344F6AD8